MKNVDGTSSDPEIKYESPDEFEINETHAEDCNSKPSPLTLYLCGAATVTIWLFKLILQVFLLPDGERKQIQAASEFSKIC